MKRVTGWVTLTLLGEALLAWLLPLISSLIAIAIAQATDTAVFFTFVGVIIVAAMTSTLLLNFNRWRDVTRIEGKLAFQHVRLLPVHDNSGKLRAVRLGVQFVNQANLPIAFVIRSMQTQVTAAVGQQTLYPPAKDFIKTEFEVRPGDGVLFDAYDIALPMDVAGVFLAEVRCTIAYGKAPNSKYTFTIAKRGDFTVREGAMLSSGIWYDA